jgi:hypothetical protein
LFNNPFREQAVAASANRQQLDRLLRVTAPHERIVLVAVGLILAGVVGWVVFGSITRDVTLEGTLVAAGQQATVHVTPRVARRVRSGMHASVDVQLPGGATRRLEGVVGAVAAAPPRVDIDLQPPPDLVLPDGTPCRVRIILGRHSPASLLLGFGSS